MRGLCNGRGCSCDADAYPHFYRRGSRLEYPLLLIRKRQENGTRGYAGMASEKPFDGVSDEDWSAFRSKVNSTIFTCPFSYGRVLLFIVTWVAFVATSVIATFGAIGPSLYFWEGFWKCCQSKDQLFHEPYTYEFCAQYSGWGSACMLAFFILFCGGLFACAYVESRRIKRWRREVEPVLVSMCKEHAPIFEKHGYSIEMQGWKIIFRGIRNDEDNYEPPKIIEVFSIKDVDLPIEQV